MTDDAEMAWVARVWTNWAVAGLLALAFGAIAWLAVGNADSEPAKANRASDPSATAASFIIQGTTSYSVEALAKTQGWTVTDRLALIDAIAVSAPPEQVTRVAPRWPGVIRITPNYPLSWGACAPGFVMVASAGNNRPELMTIGVPGNIPCA